MNIPFRAKGFRCLLVLALNCLFFILLWTKECNNSYQQLEDPALSSKQRSTIDTFEFSGTAETINRKNKEPYIKIIRGYPPSSNINPQVKDTPILNDHRFHYPINIVDVCGKSKVDVLIPVQSAVTNFERRKKTRQSNQGQYASVKENRALLLFFVGQPTSASDSSETQKQLRQESEEYHDVIQINVEDVYHNISLKALSVLNWITNYCNNSEFILKTDDDIVLNTPKAVSALHWAKKSQPHFVMGYVRRLGRPVYRHGKYRVDEADYAPSTFPPYVAGAAMGYPTATALLLYRQAIRVKRLWLDDAFISGICTEKLGIPVIGASQFEYTHKYT